MFNSTAVVESLVEIASSGGSRQQTEEADVHIATSERYINLKAFEAATAIKRLAIWKVDIKIEFLEEKGYPCVHCLLRQLPMTDFIEY